MNSSRTKEMPDHVTIHQGYHANGDPFYELIHEQIGYLGRVSLYDKRGLALGKQIGVTVETLEKQSDESIEHYMLRMNVFMEASGIIRDAIYTNFSQNDNEFVMISALDGSVYEGQIVDGVPNGMGRFISPSGVVIYQGYWVNGVWCGFGRLYYPSGKLLCYGEFRNGTVNGYVRFYDENGNVMDEGYCVDGKIAK